VQATPITPSKQRYPRSARPAPSSPAWLISRTVAAVAVVFGILGATVAVSTTAADDNPYQRGPNPSLESVGAVTGPFEIESVNVVDGPGFGGGVIYYPTDTSQGTFGAIAIVPGLNTPWSLLSWMGPHLASHGFVVFGIDTINLNDSPNSRGVQLLAALDYLTQSSPVSDRVDASRLAVAGHSLGGGGAIEAGRQRSSLRAVVGMAPFPFPVTDLSTLTVPTLIYAAQNDTLVTPNFLTGIYNTLPATTESAYVEIAGVGHGYVVAPNLVQRRTWVPWLKVLVDNDRRYHRFVCPLMDSSGITVYRNTCPLKPPNAEVAPLAVGFGEAQVGTLAHGIVASTQVAMRSGQRAGLALPGGGIRGHRRRRRCWAVSEARNPEWSKVGRDPDRRRVSPPLFVIHP
jgi:dienelactone hydrolase